MDSEKFDDLIKRIGTARVDRLTALKGLAGGALAAAAGLAVATGDAEAGKKRGKKRGKKKSRRSPAVAPVYNAPEAPKEEHKPTTSTTTSTSTTSAPTCPKDKYEDCGYDAKWSDKSCSCECNSDDYAWCSSKDSYAYGTCVDTSYCDEYNPYNEKTCACEARCYPKTCSELGYECGKVDDGCGTELDCGHCNGKEYAEKAYCDEYGKCACDAYTTDDCSYLYDSYKEECKYDDYGYPYEAEVKVSDGCGEKIYCPCSRPRA